MFWAFFQIALKLKRNALLVVGILLQEATGKIVAQIVGSRHTPVKRRLSHLQKFLLKKKCWGHGCKVEISEQQLKEELKAEAREQFWGDVKENEINWVEGDFWDSWDKVVGHMKKLWRHKKVYWENDTWKKCFIAHSKDIIIGKPLLIQNTKVRLPLVRQAIKKVEDKDSGEDVEIQSFYMLGEKFDKRHDGFQREAFSLDFYKYRIETPDDKEVYVFSREKLSSENCLLRGMLVELDDYSEMSRTMKLPSLSRIFFVKESEPAVKTLDKKALMNLVKEHKITEEGWLLHLVTHPFGTINNFPMESEMLHSAQMLCGKFDGWPLHICYMGPQGTRKTMGKGETTEAKFGKEKIIIDSGNVRLKGLTPSYKGVVTKPGYLAEQNRIGIIDELGKMVEAESKRHDAVGTNILGELNSILEHKERLAVSGNTSTSNMKPTAKFIFITNPVQNRETISDHVGLIDATTMSRILWWVQDEQEQEFVLGPDGIVRCSPQDLHKTIDKGENPPYTHASIYNWNSIIEERKKDILLKKSWGKYIEEDIYLTIYDSCYNFVSDIDYKEVQKLADTTTNLAREPMRGVWKPRSFHHIFLLVDGLVKQRCLFKDCDSSFTAKQEDYNLAERILIRMVRGWETDLSPKEDFVR